MAQAMIPFVGKFGDMFGLRFGMIAICVTIGYLIFIAFWAKPLINNATIGSKKKAAMAA